MNVNSLVTLFAVLLISLTSTAFSNDEANQVSVENAVLSWLSEIDNKNYATSWNKAAPLFQANVTQEKWIQALSKVRKPLGHLQTRSIKKIKLHSSLPGIPDGEYAVFTLSSSFDNKQSAIETLTVMKADQEWKAIGYFIK